MSSPSLMQLAPVGRVNAFELSVTSAVPAPAGTWATGIQVSPFRENSKGERTL